MGRKAESAQLEKEKEIICKNNSVVVVVGGGGRSFPLVPSALLLKP